MTIAGERMSLTLTGTETALMGEALLARRVSLVQKVKSQLCVPITGGGGVTKDLWTPAPLHKGLNDPARQSTDINVEF